VSTPGILLFDLNLPRESGLEGLRPKSRTSDSIRGLTKSKAEDDMEKSYGLHANCYVPKPVELAKLADAVQGMRDFWLCLVTPPLEKK
jgi:DNA-binding response OmpR family regulator